ncbi:MAG TPA: diguanylate cyclase [Pilimelia sp.]|nr:diguanylate cyclase [Pilimelia sp.]
MAIPGSIEGVVNGLEVVEELGRGAWTIVYRARRRGADYALKVMKAPVADDEQALVAFRREAGLLTCLTDPGLARIYEVGCAHGRPYLVMELLEGQNLDSLLAAGPLDEARAGAIAVDVAGALAAAHRAGLVHRDVKSENIMILPDGQAKVIDFGLAIRAADGVEESVAGTFSYMAPEQTGMLKRLVDGRSDLYSLGVVLFRATTGRLPFVAPDIGELMRLHTVAPAPDVRTLRPELSAMFAAIVAKLLAKDPDDRYQTAQGLIADLERLRAGDEPQFRLGCEDSPVAELDVPLVARAAALTDLMVRWDKARSGQGGVALVCGAPGVGKSRLVRELVAAARDVGGLVLQGKAVPDDPMPFAPIRSAVEQYLNAVDRLPSPARTAALDRIRAAARPMASLVRTLSPALAGLLDAPPVELADEDRQEQFAAAVAAFLTGLARQAGDAILYLDDVQWLDPATRRVMRHLADDLADTPLLVAVTARDDGPSRAALAAFSADLDHVIDTRLELPALDDAAVGQLLAAHLGGAAVVPELTARLAACSGGNPFTAEEYLWTAIDAGLIRPSWGVWVLEEGGLDALELSADVLRLVLSRVDGLGLDSRRVLAAAAAMGMRFRPDRLAAVCGLDERRVLEVIRVATNRHLVGPGETGEYVFVHDRIREALLADLDEAALRSVHQRIAQVLEALPAGGAEHVYAVAQHYSRGEVDRTPDPVFRACCAAGQLALAEYAPQEALGFLELADAAAARAGIDPDSRFHTALGLAYLRSGRFAEARDRLGQALTTEPERNQRAMLHGLIGEAHLSCYELDEALAAARRGLAELGRPLPTKPLLLVICTIGLFVGGLLVKWLRLGFGTATGEQRERYQLEAWLAGVAAQPAAIGRRMLLMSCLVLREVYPANRLGISPEYVRAHTQLAGASRMIGLRHRSNRIYQQMHRIAMGLGDPRSVAYVAWNDATVQCAVGDSPAQTIEMLRRVLAEHGRWLDAEEYLLAAGALCYTLTFCGHPRESLAWYQRGRVEVTTHEHARGHAFAAAGVANRAMLGHGEEVAAQLRAMRGALDEQPANRDAWIHYITAAVMTAVEQNQLGDEFESAIAEVRRMGLSPRRAWPTVRILFVNLAYGRLAQAIGTSGEQRPARLAAAGQAIDELRRAASTPLIRAHYLILRAAYRQLTGDNHVALRHLTRAERIAQGLDAPILEYEISRVRARALRSLGHTAEAHRQARRALLLATEYGWEHRVRWIRSEFRVGEISHHNVLASTSSELNRRRLDALQQVSLAAARILDPRELARVALDETIRILGAERAFLFLRDRSGALRPELGRAADGTELDMLTGYSTSLVERVHASGEPMVLTSDDDGRALRSHSAAAHGLLSIMVAPLQLKDRLLGVVYLDSRVAKGIFTGDDVDILMAIINHVAASLETARAAQLELAVQAARRQRDRAETQRDLAETLRSAMSEISQTLDPDEVLGRLLVAVAGIVPGEAACLLRQDGATVTVAAASERPDPTAARRRLDPAADPTLATLLESALPVLGTATAAQPAPLPELLPGLQSWIAVPLSGQTGPVALLLIASTTADVYTQTHVEIAAVLAGQGMVAYQNACLFDQVRHLAATDALTGTYNRRRFFELASHRFTTARTHHNPLSAIMIDIDHFKQINDRYGHLVGDEVIREITGRLLRTVRERDLIGRYGGEEFSLIVEADTDVGELAERLRAAVAATPITTEGGPLHATVSIGIAQLRPGDPDLSALLARADAALYQAKRRGRNCVVSA